MRRVIAFILLLSVCFSIKSVGLYNDYFTLVSDNYVAGIPQDLSQQAVIQNSYLISLSPKISVDDVPLNFSTSIPTALFDNPSDKYVIENKEVVSDMDISGRISAEGDQIVSDVSVRNTGSAAVKLDLEYRLNGQDGRTFSAFSPENYNNKTGNYLVLLQLNYNGQALAVIGSQEIRPSFVGILKDTVYVLYFSVPELGAGQTFSMQLKYRPFVLKEEGTLDYPIDLYCYMSEPLIKTAGTAPAINATGEIDEKITSMMNAVSILAKKTGEFSGIHDVNFDEPQFDSLDSSVYFKQLCINSDVPCRLVIGKKDEMYYAWVKVYNGNWIDIDIQNNARQTPFYDAFYLEPKTGVHTMPLSEDAGKMLFDGTSWIASIGQTGFLIYFIIIIVIASMVIFLFQFKKVILGKLMAKKGVFNKVEAEVDGKYEVLSEEIDDPFLREIIRRIKEKDGLVKMEQLVETMHFSKELIEDGIRYLLDQKFIKKVM